MINSYIFPFGNHVQLVEQIDKSPKDVFILGVYASAVHAKWLNGNDIIINALAVASEPYIFWHGENANEIIKSINVPKDIGKLEPASKNLNGPSGRSLDAFYLRPLGLTRKDVWLCDIIPHSCLNINQFNAIQKKYVPLIDKYNLPKVTIPRVPNKLSNKDRCIEILKEIYRCDPELIILLGDQPVKWFINYFERKKHSLSDFISEANPYGSIHNIKLDNKDFNILPLVHPRQAAKIGVYSKEWYLKHLNWVNKQTS